MVEFVGAKQSGENIRRLRGKESRISVAKACGVTVSAIQMYENGARVPKDEIKAALANHFGKRVEDIFFKHNTTKC